MFRNKLARVAACAIVLSVPAAAGAFAQAPHSSFDGEWVLDVPPSVVIEGTSYSACPALRIPVRIQDGHVDGSLMRVPTPDAGLMLEAGVGPNAAPISGGVSPDGAIEAQWEGFQASGTLAGNAGQVTVQTQCGPMVANAVRVGGPAFAHTASAGR
ncbi:MAG TPA: hypothetical protein VL993_10905 [Stellaceae bacterium]|nr:hypothetical protein [Stellaceae bacterium]